MLGSRVVVMGDGGFEKCHISKARRGAPAEARCLDAS
jgi:hypothetical protein